MSLRSRPSNSLSISSSCLRTSSARLTSRRANASSTLRSCAGGRLGPEGKSGTGRGLAAGDDGRQVTVDLDFHLVDAQLAVEHEAGRLAAEVGQRVDRLGDLRLDEPAHLEDAVRDLAEFGVELRGQVLVGHGLVPGNNARLSAAYTVLGIAEEWLRTVSRSGR